MSIPLEKLLLIMCWKDNPLISFTNMCKLLRLKDISIIANFFHAQKTFPDRPYYVLREIKRILRHSFSKLNIPEKSQEEYISKEDLLRHILIKQYKYGIKFRHFLSCFYKQLRPSSKIKCFLCRRSSSKIIYDTTYTPICKNCYIKRARIKWRRRGIRVSKVKFKKLLSKKGFTREIRNETNILVDEFNLLPLLNSRRISTIKDCSQFPTLGKAVRMINKIPYRILLEVKNGPECEDRRYQIRLAYRPRIRKR